MFFSSSVTERKMKIGNFMNFIINTILGLLETT